MTMQQAKEEIQEVEQTLKALIHALDSAMGEFESTATQMQHEKETLVQLMDHVGQQVHHLVEAFEQSNLEQEQTELSLAIDTYLVDLETTQTAVDTECRETAEACKQLEAAAAETKASAERNTQELEQELSELTQSAQRVDQTVTSDKDEVHGSLEALNGVLNELTTGLEALQSECKKVLDDYSTDATQTFVHLIEANLHELEGTLKNNGVDDHFGKAASNMQEHAKAFSEKLHHFSTELHTEAAKLLHDLQDKCLATARHEIEDAVRHMVEGIIREFVSECVTSAEVNAAGAEISGVLAQYYPQLVVVKNAAHAINAAVKAKESIPIIGKWF